jgi:hypothetical protein
VNKFIRKHFSGPWEGYYKGDEGTGSKGKETGWSIKERERERDR